MSLIKQIAVIGGIGVLLYMGVQAAMPRGIRNKNPLNIEYNKANDWEGQTGVEPEGRFARFSAAKYGIRAGAKLISNYMTIHNKQSVIAILERFAQPTKTTRPTMPTLWQTNWVLGSPSA